MEVEWRKPRNLFVCASEEREDGERGEREGEGTEALSLSSGTHWRHNSLAEDADSVYFKIRSQELRCVSRFFVYYESIKRELNKRLAFDSRCDARLKAKAEGCTRLTYTMCREEP